MQKSTFIFTGYQELYTDAYIANIRDTLRIYFFHHESRAKFSILFEDGRELLIFFYNIAEKRYRHSP